MDLHRAGKSENPVSCMQSFPVRLCPLHRWHWLNSVNEHINSDTATQRPEQTIWNLCTFSSLKPNIWTQRERTIFRKGQSGCFQWCVSHHQWKCSGTMCDRRVKSSISKYRTYLHPAEVTGTPATGNCRWLPDVTFHLFERQHGSVSLAHKLLFYYFTLVKCRIEGFLENLTHLQVHWHSSPSFKRWNNWEHR